MSIGSNYKAVLKRLEEGESYDDVKLVPFERNYLNNLRLEETPQMVITLLRLRCKQLDNYERKNIEFAFDLMFEDHTLEFINDDLKRRGYEFTSV